jgi:hypothetical protein
MALSPAMHSAPHEQPEVRFMPEQINVRVPDDMKRSVERAAAADNRTIASWVRNVFAQATKETGELPARG